MERVKTFAAIYSSKKEDNNYELESIAVVDYSPKDDDFVVMNGLYEGTTSNNFNRIICEENNIMKCPQEITIEDEKEDKKNIYIFDSEFIFNMIKEHSNNGIEAMKDLAAKLLPIKLYKNMDGSIYTKMDEKTDSKFDYDGMLTKSTPIEITEEVVNSIREELHKSFDNLISGLSTFVLINIAKNLVFESVETIEDDQKEMAKNAVKKIEDKEEDSIDNEEIEELDSSIVNEMIEEISSKIVGQRKAIETLVTNIYYNQVLIDELTKDGDYDPSMMDSRKVAILLDGETGTGKTAIEKEIAKMLDLPIVIANANSFSATGYVGPTITDLLYKLLDQTDGDIEQAERGIIVFDEIDKVASKDFVYGKDMEKNVQEELLSFIGGGEYDLRDNPYSDPIIFDTSKLTFILSGAFTDLREDKIKEENKKNNPMGFDGNKKEVPSTYEVVPEDYIKYGLMREFFGRIKVLASTKSYKLEDLKKILLTSMISPLKNFENSVKMFGYSGIDYEDDFVTEIASEALKMGTGARSLQTIMSGIQSNMLMGLINQQYDKDKPIKLEKKLIKEYKNTNLREI